MIKVENLSFSYGNSGKVIKNLNFEIKKGEIFGFLGPSGAGKSTTQKIIMANLRNYEGSILIDNKELKEYSNEYYEKIGVAFEFPNFYPKFTALENLNFFGSLYKTKVDPLLLLENVNLKELAHKRVGEFSKGMKMRLNFCRALINDPDIIFLDEPTSGLDPVNTQIMINLILLEKKKGKTIFLTTHNMGTADKLCDTVAFLNDGEIKLIENPRTLKLQQGEKKLIVEYFKNDKNESLEFELNNIGQNNIFLDILNSGTIETIHTQEASLEDIFIKVTGRSLL